MTEKKKATIKLTQLTQLQPYERNAKLHPEEQVKKIADSIEEFGFLIPIIADESGRILAGHGRHLAAQKIGMKKVPVRFVDHLTDDQKDAYTIADNKLAELGTYDEKKLQEELHALADMDFDPTITGFDLQSVELANLEEPELPDFVPPTDGIMRQLTMFFKEDYEEVLSKLNDLLTELKLNDFSELADYLLKKHFEPNEN